MISLRSVRELLGEASNETLELVLFLIRKADERYILPGGDPGTGRGAHRGAEGSIPSSPTDTEVGGAHERH